MCPEFYSSVLFSPISVIFGESYCHSNFLALLLSALNDVKLLHSHNRTATVQNDEYSTSMSEVSMSTEIDIYFSVYIRVRYNSTIA